MNDRCNVQLDKPRSTQDYLLRIGLTLKSLQMYDGQEDAMLHHIILTKIKISAPNDWVEEERIDPCRF